MRPTRAQYLMRQGVDMCGCTPTFRLHYTSSSWDVKSMKLPPIPNYAQWHLPTILPPLLAAAVPVDLGVGKRCSRDGPAPLQIGFISCWAGWRRWWIEGELVLGTEGKGGGAESKREDSYLIWGLKRIPQLLSPWCSLPALVGRGRIWD